MLSVLAMYGQNSFQTQASCLLNVIVIVCEKSVNEGVVQLKKSFLGGISWGSEKDA